MFNCPKCEKSYKTIQSLSSHYRKGHKLSSKELYVSLFFGGTNPTCECGCGEETKYHDITRGFSKFRRGHVARIKNNWGHNEKAQQKSQKTRQEMSKRGELTSWCAGLTKETDDRVARYGKKIAASWNDEKRQMYSKRMTKNRLEGIIPSNRGPNHPNWKGGVSTLSTLCHSNPRLYKEWKYPKLVAAGFKCERCGSTDSLHVHHSETRMAEIVHEVRSSHPELLCDPETLTLMVNQAIDIHANRDIPGLVLCIVCHGTEHPSLNFESRV